jgi:hypothetical protein
MAQVLLKPLHIENTTGWKGSLDSVGDSISLPSYKILLLAKLPSVYFRPYAPYPLIEGNDLLVPLLLADKSAMSLMHDSGIPHYFAFIWYLPNEFLSYNSIRHVHASKSVHGPYLKFYYLAIVESGYFVVARFTKLS